MKQESYEEIIRQIRALEIQGAINVALGGVRALYVKSREVKSKTELSPFVDEIKSTRSTEPAMRNLLNLYVNKLSEDLKNTDEIFEEINTLTKESSQKIYEIGANQIKDGMSIFTVCHSSTVVGILKTAWDQGKKFDVFNTETRPQHQGRKTAKRLVEFGIPVTHFVDNAAYRYMRKCDIFMFGADAVNSMGDVYNKVGTHAFAELAKRYELLTLCCTNSVKFNAETEKGFTEEVEYRSIKEIWDFEHPNLTIVNPAFDKVEKEAIDGIVCEWGIYSPVEFVRKAMENYKVKDLI